MQQMFSPVRVRRAHTPSEAATDTCGAARGRARRGGALAVAIALALCLAAPALAATPASVSTGGPRFVTYGSAILTGTVVPHGSDTSYYFQYGVTRAYGSQSGIADAGAGTQPVKVALPVTGLAPVTLYHYRLVAVNAAGASIGSDQTLLTAKVPLSLQIVASPDPVAFGGPVTIQGALSGTGNGEREVVLQADAFPYTAGFQNFGNPLLTLPDGGFSFVVGSLAVNTQFRVVTVTSPPVLSPVGFENVAVTVVSHLARARRPHFVRIYGTVTPAEDGMQVGVLRFVHGRSVLVGGATLHHRNASSSAFSLVVPARRGVYRVLARVINAAQVSSYGQPLLIG